MTQQLVGIVIGASISLIGVILLIRNILHARKARHPHRPDDVAMSLNKNEKQKYETHCFHDAEYVNDETDPALAELGFADEIVSSARVSKSRTSKFKKASLNENDLVILNVLAKPDQIFGGYELLQALANANLTFGDMNIFHRYSQRDGQGDIWFSVASATEPGTFDMQKLGALQCSGLTMFLTLTGFPKDLDRFDLMFTTAMQLKEDLDGLLLDARRQPLTDEGIDQYRKNIRQYHHANVIV